MKREWVPAAVAGGIAVLLVWLAGEPLALRPEDVRVGGPIWWGDAAFLRVPNVVVREPSGDVPAFPSEFRWAEIERADAYEITVGPDVPGAPPLFRRRGPGAGLSLEISDSARTPSRGDYVLEVRALRGEEILARGVGRVRVVAPSRGAPPDSTAGSASAP